ncbi:glycerophosphodiester phosphodiesterase family protein [Flavobacteriales bacterium]|nr:glycerophosphodiester phosphodiesterase family protein [Flavobacteriales bacterium]
MRKALFVLFLVTICIGLVGWKYLHRPVEIDKTPIILGHGGMGVRSTLPLNSLESIKKALSHPIAGTEIDVRMTADGVLIAFHGENLKSETNCAGFVSKTTFAEISNCENSTWLKSAKIERLEDILDENYPKGSIFSLDLKENFETESNRSALLVDELKKLPESFQKYKFLIESMDLPFLIDLKKNEVNAELFFYAHNLETDLDKILAAELDGISINMNLCSAEQIASAQEANLKVMLWGTGSVFSNREAVNMKPNIIQTDDIGSMSKLVKR